MQTHPDGGSTEKMGDDKRAEDAATLEPLRVAPRAREMQTTLEVPLNVRRGVRPRPSNSAPSFLPVSNERVSSRRPAQVCS